MNLAGIIEILFAIYCCYFVTYALVFTIAGFFSKKQELNNDIEKHRIAVLIPAYQCDEVILNTVRRNLLVSYPENCYKIFVISDGLKKITNEKLDRFPIELIQVNFKQSTKVKSLKKCLENPLMDHYDSVVILDADNIMHKDFLKHMNQKLFDEKAIQGKRVASNENNVLAVLDGISESLNITTFRKGPEVLGLSVSLSGSGMAFTKDQVKHALKLMESVGGFDRELEFELLSKGIRSSYLDEAIVYDEKTDELDNFKNQRKRWLSSHFVYLKRYFKPGIINLLKGNFTYFHSTVLRNIQLPRSLNIGLLAFLTFLSVILSFFDIWYWPFWLFLWSVNAISTFIAIPRMYYNRRLLKAIIHLPILVGNMFLLLFRLKGANKKFIHTTHKMRK